MKILGISAFYHDAAAAIIENGQILAAAQEERFTRKKHDPSFPLNAIRYCLEFSGFALCELDAVVFYDKPFLKFERLLETYYAFAPSGVASFIKSMPVWVKEKMLLKKIIRDELQGISDTKIKDLPLLFPEHHLSHAASAFYPSPFEDAAIITIDGVGEWATSSIGLGKGSQIEVLKEMRFPNSLGLLYSAFTYYLGFRVNSGEYKLMGLAPYGNPDSEETHKFIKLIESHLIEIQDDGSIWLDQSYFKYCTGLRMTKDKKWKNLFGLERRKPESSLEQVHCNLALAIQKVTEKVVIKMGREAKRLTGAKNVCLAGGVALNCVANGRLQKEGIFENIWIQPAAGDAGGAVGAALAAHYLHFQKERHLSEEGDSMQGAYLGPEFSETEILKVVKKFKTPFQKAGSQAALVEKIASLINDGNIIGWFQGRMEFGPRALGNRSIIADARSPEMQKRLNLKIKYRESFRPFAPSVLWEDAHEFFELETPSPYMLLVQNVNETNRKKVPPDYSSFPLKEKLYYQRSDIPAVTHVDYSARIQTVHKETNSLYHALISAFKDLTKFGILINTSFNVRGEPIVCTPEDAFRCFLRTEMDFLVIGNFIFDKREQKKTKHSEQAAAITFALD